MIMSKIECFDGQNPYKNMSALKTVILSVLEMSTGCLTVLRQLSSPEKVGITTAQHLLVRAAGVVNDPTGVLKKTPIVESYLGRGFESSVFIFTAGSTRWVMKVGAPNGFTAGMLSPSTDEYASIQRWNYKMLRANYTEQLPHILPSPYFIVSPSEINYPSTLQVVPYIDKVANSRALSNDQMKQIRDEKIKFYLLSKKFVKNEKLIPDLIKLNNLIIGLVNGEPHMVLLDIGLFNLYAPTPVLNFFAFSALRVFFVKDILSSRKMQSKK